MAALLMRLRSPLLRRLLVAFMLGTMVPVATASVICQMLCAVSTDHGESHAHGESPDHPVADAPAADTGTHGLSHGPCQLAAVPTAPSGAASAVLLKLTFEWARKPPFGMASHVRPPPDPPPKA